jgi:uncharacterized protein (DUF1330 family)
MKRSIVGLMLLLSGCYISRPVIVVKSPAPMQHVVICWLKDPGDAKEADQLIAASNDFRKLKGVVRVFAGRQHSVATTRPIDDGSFDVMVVMSFESPEALRDYQASKEHQDAVKKVLQPLTRKVVVYDAYNPATPADSDKVKKKKA